MMKHMKFISFMSKVILTSLVWTTSVFATPISLNIKDMNLHDAIMLIANIGNLNVSLNYDNQNNKSDKITISINDVEAIDALKILPKQRI